MCVYFKLLVKVMLTLEPVLSFGSDLCVGVWFSFCVCDLVWCGGLWVFFGFVLFCFFLVY